MAFTILKIHLPLFYPLQFLIVHMIDILLFYCYFSVFGRSMSCGISLFSLFFNVLAIVISLNITYVQMLTNEYFCKRKA